MIRNLKALGLALVAVLAMGALSASTASAVTTHFFTTEDGDPAYLTGTSHDNTFSIGALGFECTTSRFTGTAVNGSSEATVLAAYNGTPGVTPHTSHCDADIGTVTVDMNDCHYDLSGITNKGDPGAGETHGAVSIDCPTGKTITITSNVGCTVHIADQTATEGGVTYTDLPTHTGGKAIEVTATATGISYTTSPHFACTLGGLQTTGNNAVYNGSVTVTGYEDNESTKSELTNITEGSQIDVEVSN